jgi:hypothetical protein
MSMKRRVARLEQRLPPTPQPAQEDLLRQQQWGEILRRWEALYQAAVPLLADAEREGVAAAFAELAGAFRGPYATWLGHLDKGWCRLPQLPPTVMKDLLLTWCSPAVDGGQVCNRCGLEYPCHKRPPLSEWKVLPGKKPLEGSPPWYDLPEFFPACPCCGAALFDITWPHRTVESSHPWQELDGYVSRSRTATGLNRA